MPWPYFEEDEIQAVERVLRSGKINYWTGDEGQQFEAEFAAFHERNHGVLLANGTLALELALYVLGVGPGDEVIVPSKTFLATASSVFMRGATPVCADVDVLSQNVTPETIEAVWTPKTKAIICVHFAGMPCAMDTIMDFAKEKGLFVIEDCAQSHGAVYKGKRVGSWGHMAAFSFCQDKIMTTGGEGGMLLLDDEAWWKKAWSYKDHGKNYDTVYKREHPPGFRWLHEDFGTNWRMTEMQATIGRCQLKKLDSWVSKRRELANILNNALSEIPGLHAPTTPDFIQHSYYKYYLILEADALTSGWTRNRILEACEASGVTALQGGCSEIYLEKCFEKYSLGPDVRHKNAAYLSEHSFMLPLHHNLARKEVEKTAEAIKAVLRLAIRNPVGSPAVYPVA